MRADRRYEGEGAIGRQVEWLKNEDVISKNDTFNLRIDYTTHNY